MSDEILTQQAEPAVEETVIPVIEPAVEPVAEPVVEAPAKPARKVRKRWPWPVRFLMGIIGFVLCIVMFVTALTGIVLLDLRAMTSENGITTIIETLFTSGKKAPATVRPGLAVGGVVRRAEDSMSDSTHVEIDANGNVVVNGEVVGSVGDMGNGNVTLIVPNGNVTTDENGNVYVDGELLEGATMGEDGTVNMGGQITVGPNAGGDSSDAIVDWVVGQLQDFTGGELPVTPEQIENFVEQSTIKDFIAEKVAGMVGDFYTGNITTTITMEEITQLVEENKALIQSEFGIEITEEHTEALKQIVEDTGILEQVQEQGIMGILGSVGGMGGVGGDGEGGGLMDPGMMQQMQQIQMAVEIVRQVTSYTAIAAVGLIFLALAAILFCTTQFSWPATLADCGVVLMLASAIFVIPSTVFTNSPELVTELLGNPMLVKLAQTFFNATAGVNYGAFGVGVGLIVLAIVAACIRSAMRKKAA